MLQSGSRSVKNATELLFAVRERLNSAELFLSALE